MYIYIDRETKRKRESIIQEFNLSVGSHVRITLSCKLCSWRVWEGKGKVGMGDLSPPPIFLYITIWLNILIHAILLSRFNLTSRDL